MGEGNDILGLSVENILDCVLYFNFRFLVQHSERKAHKLLKLQNKSGRNERKLIESEKKPL